MRFLVLRRPSVSGAFAPALEPAPAADVELVATCPLGCTATSAESKRQTKVRTCFSTPSCERRAVAECQGREGGKGTHRPAAAAARPRSRRRRLRWMPRRRSSPPAPPSRDSPGTPPSPPQSSSIGSSASCWQREGRGGRGEVRGVRWPSGQSASWVASRGPGGVAARGVRSSLATCDHRASHEQPGQQPSGVRMQSGRQLEREGDIQRANRPTRPSSTGSAPRPPSLTRAGSKVCWRSARRRPPRARASP